MLDECEKKRAGTGHQLSISHFEVSRGEKMPIMVATQSRISPSMLSYTEIGVKTAPKLQNGSKVEWLSSLREMLDERDRGEKRGGGTI